MKYSVRNNTKIFHNPHEGNPYMKILEKKLKDELNNFCVECGNENPEFISINNGIFICSECVQNHLQFPKNISRIVNNNIKSLTLDEIQFLLCGGNRALLNFINNDFPKLSEFPPYILYRTQAMVYYRQNLQYLINGGIAPIKPSLKYAYKVSNFISNLQSEFNNMKENINNNFTMSENETFNTIQEEKRFLNNNNFEYYANRSNFNFTRGRNMNNKSFNDRFINNNNSIGKNYDTNYIINKPRQVNFQNNNNIIIGNINTHNDLSQISQGRLMTSQEKLNIGTKPKNKRRIKSIMNVSNNCFNNENEVYVKPKLVLSPKVNINCLTINGILSQRIQNEDYINDYNKDVKLFEEKKRINKNMIKKRLNKTSSQDFYILTQNRGFGINKKSKYIHKSLSQKSIKDESGKIINKNIIKNYKDKKYSINTDEKYELLSKIREMKYNNKNNNIFKDNNNYDMDKKSNKKNFVTEQNHGLCEVESLPIKINLKNKNNNNKTKEIKVDLCKNHIINEKNYFSSDESKIKDDNNSNIKKINNEKEILNTNINDKEKEKENISDKKIKNNKLNLCKNFSQSNITKESKDKNKKFNGDKVNNKDINKVSIRNKYKLKRKINN